MCSRSFNRRQFIKTSALLAAAQGLLPAWKPSKSVAAEECKSKNDRPQFALIGSGDEGKVIASGIGSKWWHGRGAVAFGDLAAICDVDRRRAEAAQALFGLQATLYEDYRKVLDRKDIDAVLIATPDHWHTKIAAEAMQAGKDVYCEKPLTLTIDEGKLLCRVAKQTGAVFQVGSQQRSCPQFRLAVELVRNGRIGKLRRILITLTERKPMPEGPFPVQPVPPQLNWDFWLGQAPWADYCPERCHHFFRCWFEYSGGLVTDWAPHHLDIVHWAMDCDDSGPTTIDGRGKLPNIPGGMNVPKSFTIDYVYGNGVPVHCRTDPERQRHSFRGRPRATIRQSPENHRQADRRTQGAPLARKRRPGRGERQPHGQFFRVHEEPPNADFQRPQRPPRGVGLAFGQYLHPAGTQIAVGSRERADRRRRRGQPLAQPSATISLRDSCVSFAGCVERSRSRPVKYPAHAVCRF